MLKQSSASAADTLANCRTSSSHGVDRPPHALRPHLVSFGCAAKTLKFVKLSPKQSPCPDAAIQTSNLTKLSLFTRVNRKYGLRTPVFATLFLEGRNMFSRAAIRPSIGFPLASPAPGNKRPHKAPTRPPRRPTCSFPRFLQLKMALMCGNPCI